MSSNQIKLADIMVEGSRYEISLVKLVGCGIVDIRGFVSDPYGGGPMFQLTGIFFEDGTHVDCEGEHDYPYIGHSFSRNPALNVPNLDTDTLEDLYHQQEVCDGEVTR